MKAKVLLSLTLTTAVMLLMVAASWADVPPPPVNQIIGLPDGVFNDLVEPGCRACHEDPGIVNPGTIPDRHHLLVGQEIPDPTAAPHGTPGEIYECLSCHELQWVDDHYEFVSFRDCLLCHLQIDGQASVHHMTPAAEAKDCKACHGPIDNPLDGHYIPEYPPSMVTPYTGMGTGTDGQGGCKFCHAAGTDNSTGTEIPVFDNRDTHHSTGIGQGVIPGSTLTCELCHDMSVPAQERIRRCEDCHGVNSLHNIQADSNGNGVNPGGEDPWYGHIGNNVDCNGCHQTWTSSAAESLSRPIIPNISGLSQSTVTAGVETSITITGSAFINDGYSSVVSLTAPDGTETNATLTEVSETSMIVTIPADLARGNYALRAVKAFGGNSSQVSNCLNISLVPEVVITSVDRVGGTATITGSGFCDYVKATDSGTGVFMTTTDIDSSRITTNVTTTNPCPITSWNDTEIVAECGTSSGTIKVDSVYGSASVDVESEKGVLFGILKPLRR